MFRDNHLCVAQHGSAVVWFFEIGDFEGNVLEFMYLSDDDVVMSIPWHETTATQISTLTILTEIATRWEGCQEVAHPPEVQQNSLARCSHPLAHQDKRKRQPKQRLSRTSRC